MGKGHVKGAMRLAGSEHKFQSQVVILLSVGWVLTNFMFLCSTYIFMQPVFGCASRPNDKFHEVQACRKLDQCTIMNKFTLTSQMNLYCDRQWVRVMIQSVFPIGAFTGLIVMNLLSDTKGRKLAFLSTLVISMVGVVLVIYGGLNNSILSLTIAQFLLGFGAYAIIPLGYTFLSDFFSDSFRPIAVIIVNSAGGFGPFALGIFYLFKISWYHFMIYAILLPLVILLIASSVYLQESPYILMNLNQQEKALKVLQNIANFNGRAQNIVEMRRIIEAQSVRNSDSEASLQNVYKKIKEWKYLKPIILLTLIYGIGNLNFYGISYSFEGQGFGFGYNSMIAGFVQMGSFVFLNITVRKVNRRTGMAFFYSLVMLIGLSFLIPQIKQNLLISTILLAISRICSTNAYCLLACVQTQAFTVQIQSTAAGLIQAFALYGALLAPIIINISGKMDINPIATVAFFVNFAIWPTYFLRQTFQKSNPPNTGQLFKHLKDYGQQMQDLTSVTSTNSQTQHSQKMYSKVI